MKKLLIATLVMASLSLSSTYAMAATPLIAEKGVQPTTKVIHQPADSRIQKGIEYSKQISLNEDGSAGVVVETWVDPVTHDKRIDMMAKESNGTIHPISQYLLENGTKWVEVSRDKNGKAISGKYCNLTKEEGQRPGVDVWKTFADLKFTYSQTGWENEGTAKAADGESVVNILGTGLLQDDIQPAGSKVVMSEYAQVDKDTGLPVKLSVHSVYNGVKTFEYAFGYEHKYVEDKSVFDLGGIAMKEYTKLQWVYGVEY